MKLRKLIYLLYISVFVFALADRVDAKNYEATTNMSLAKSSAINPNETLLDVNNQTVWLRQDGYFHWSDHFAGLNGTFPKGTSGTVFAQGAVWGGKVNDGNNPVVRVNGSTYNNGLQAGKVLVDANGKATGADSPEGYRVWRVHRNWETMNLVTPASQFFGKQEGQVTDADIAEIREQYRTDWVNWPADKGAPYEDVNNDGNYDPDVDIPGYPGADQTLWIVANDLNPGISASVYGSPPIGLEMQQTLWGYNFPASSPLGNIAFLRTRLIYTGTPDGSDDATIDSMYVSHWVDPDVGDAGDDYAGTDTTLSLGYAYNGNATDAQYLNNFGLAAPATGWDFLQGPIVDTGSGPDTLGLSAFTYFAAGSPIDDPDLGDYNGSLQFYNLMRGFLPRPEYPEGEPWVSPSSDTTKFVLAGDPVAGTGWIDGIDLSPGDRRIVMATGPFTMAVGDTQDIVVGQISALGSDNLGSVTLLKNYDVLAQRAYDQDFQLVTPPSVPTVESEPLDKKIVINWGNNVSEVQDVENLYSRGFAFEGYNVYQLPSASASIAEGVKLATFDKSNGVTTLKGLAVDPATGVQDSIITQNGSDSGLKRFIEITEDKIRNRPLSNGVEYYFAIQAYSYLQNPGDNVFGIPSQSLESPPFIVTATPQPVKPSMEYTSAQGDTVEVTHVEGASDGVISPIVVDPSLTTGDTYRVAFDTTDAGDIVYHIINVTQSDTVAKNQANQSGDDDYLVIDGLLVKVSGPPPGLKQVLEVDQDGNVVDPGVSILEFSLGSTGYIMSNRAGDVNLDPFERDFDRFGLWGVDDFEINFNEESVAWQYIPENTLAEKIPFSVYRHNFETGDRERMFVTVYDEGYGDVTAADGAAVWDTTGTDDLFHRSAYEPFYAYISADGPYDPADESAYLAADSLFLPPSNTGWGDDGNPTTYPIITATVIVDYLGNGLPVGNSVMFLTNKPNSYQDVFEFTAPDPVDTNNEVTADEIEKINVFPNPYYGFHQLETGRFDKFVTFTHLPERATIRIYNLAGVMVRKIEHNDPSQFQRWDLTNQDDLPVASGVYIALVQTEFGQKTLKLAIIQEQQILQRY